jgi:hypothetical protein
MQEVQGNGHCQISKVISIDMEAGETIEIATDQSLLQQVSRTDLAPNASETVVTAG